MGCVSTKPSMNSPPRGVEKLKLENGYAKGRYVAARRSLGQRPLGKNSGQLVRLESKSSSASYGGSGKASGGGRVDHQEGKLITREGEKESGNGGAGGGIGDEKEFQRITLAKKAGEEELVDGWPKWLTDNIPRDALAGLVPKSAESYDKLDKVGQGTYSNVYKARDRETGKTVALKKVRFDTSEPESVKFMAREIAILRKLDHPNIVKLEGLATSRMQYSLYLVFDYMQTDLAKIISRPDRLTEPQVKSYMHQLLSGLQHCHEQGILHRDIKGSNLLIDKNGMLKIADFGLANYFNLEKKRPLTSRVVTLWYRAPELLLGDTDYGIGIDLWSAGCLMAEMFAGRPVMPGRTEVEQLHRIFKLCGTPSEEYWKRLKVPTTFRPPHPYKPTLCETFRDFPKCSLGLLNILLALDPTYRGSAGSALKDEFFYTSPLACDLSGLPIIYYEIDDQAQTNEQRKQRKSKMRERSRTQQEQRRKDQALEKPQGDSASLKKESEKSAEALTVKSQEPSSSATSISSGVRPNQQEESPAPLLFMDVPSQEKNSSRSEAHPNATKNIKNRPPLSSAKTRSIKYSNDNDNMYKLNQVQRSVSTREFRKMDPRKLYKRHAMDN